MNTPHPEGLPEGLDAPEGTIVYIREVPVAALPAALQVQLNGLDQVWGVHTPEGECLALARDRRTAFFVARENEFRHVSAH
jgi:hypothetical protein